MPSLSTSPHEKLFMNPMLKGVMKLIRPKIRNLKEKFSIYINVTIANCKIIFLIKSCIDYSLFYFIE